MGSNRTKGEQTPSLDTRTLTPLPATILHQSDNINRAMVRAISGATKWDSGLNGLAYGMRTGSMKQVSGELKRGALDITIGLPIGGGVEQMWQFICHHGPEMIKSHYALWARWYKEGGAVGEYITVYFAQHCADVGYKRHPHGGFRREHKQQVIEQLKILMSIELSALFQPPGRNKPVQRLRGPLWARGLVGEQEDQYSDLFGSGRVGTPDLWEPVAFSFAPGPWFSNPEWRRYSKYVGKVSGALLHLANDTDRWAIRIGGYLATLIRTNGYACFELRVETILERANLAQSDSDRHRSYETLLKFEKAMDRLQEVAFLLEWDFSGPAAIELGDFDDQDQLIKYFTEQPTNSPRVPRGSRELQKNWRGQKVMITPPFPDDESRLASARATSIEKALKKAEHHGNLLSGRLEGDR